MIKNHIKIALRSLSKNRLSSAINILGLTIGMATALLIYIWVANEWSFDGYYADSEELYRITCQWNGAGDPIAINSIPIRLKEMAEEQIPEIKELHVMRPDFRSPLVRLEDGTLFEEKNFAYIGTSWLTRFDYEIIEGSIEAFNEDKYSIALTAEQAQKYFGTADALGKSVELYENTHTVNLIIAQNLSNSSFQFDAYLPLASYWQDQAAYEADYNSGNYNYITFADLNEESSKEQIQTQLASLLNQYDRNDKNSCVLMPIDAIRFSSAFATGDYFPHQDESSVYIFAIIGLILLFTAGLNYVSLSTAIINKNIQSIGVKKVIGASRKHLFTQAMVETSIITLAASVLSIGIVAYLLPHLSIFVDLPLRLDISNSTIWLGLSGILVLSLLTTGVYPALLSAWSKPIALMQRKNAPQQGITLRKVLVIMQFASVIVVLISTLVIYQQLQHIRQMDVGYDRSQVIKIRPNLWRDGNVQSNFEQYAIFKEELAKLSSIQSTAMTDASLSNITNGNSGSLSWEGKPADFVANVKQFRANEELLDLFDLQMAAGRWFDDELATDVNNFILNEAAIQRFGIEEPVIGKPCSFQGRDGQIIGVVKDFHFGSFRTAVEPLVIWNNKGTDNTILARIEKGQTETAIQEAEALFAELLPTIYFKYSFIDETFQQMHESEQKMGLLFQIFASLLIFISCLGLFGLAVFAAERRTKEIGIRKVLGASVAGLVTLLSKDFIKLVFIAFVIATPIAYYFMDQWLQDFAYRIELQWWVFALAGLAAVGIALLTVSGQSVRAALANPVESLRSE